MDLAEFRSQFPITRTRTFLFAGAQTPAAVPVIAAFNAWAGAWSYDPLHNYDIALRELAELRFAFARLIGAESAEVAITDNTSRASNIAARMILDRPGDILVDDSTYPSSIYPWITLGHRKLHHISTNQSSDPTALLIESINHSTAAVAVSHLAPLTGRRHDLTRLAEAAHLHGALLIVDAAQSTGVLPLDVRNPEIDILVSTAMKWLLGPPGIGFLYANADLIDEAPLGEIGYLGVEVEGEAWPHTHLPAVLPDARRFELGLPSLPGLSAARAGIQLIEAVGVPTIYEHVTALAGQCLEGLLSRGLQVRTPSDSNMRGGVVAATYPAAHELAAFLRLRGIDVGGYPWGLLRIDPHAFCVDEDVHRFLGGFDDFVALSK